MSEQPIAEPRGYAPAPAQPPAKMQIDQGWSTVMRRYSDEALWTVLISDRLQVKPVNASKDAAVLSHRSAIRLQRLSFPMVCSIRARSL